MKPIPNCSFNSNTDFNQILDEQNNHSDCNSEPEPNNEFNPPQTGSESEDDLDLECIFDSRFMKMELSESGPQKTNHGQLCTFCGIRFETENDLSKHLDTCNPEIKKVFRTNCRKCLICGSTMPSFSLCGIIRHANICLILAFKSHKASSDQTERYPNIENTMDSAEISEAVIQNAVNDETLQNIDTPESNNNAAEIQVNNENIRNNGTDLNTIESTSENDNNADAVKSAQEIESISFHISEANDEMDVVKSLLDKNARTKRLKKYPINRYSVLQAAFKVNSFPDLETRKHLAQKTQFSLIKVQDWFKHQRKTLSISSNHSKLRKEAYKSTLLKILKGHFHKNSNPDTTQLYHIGQETDMRIRQIKIWFAKKRRGLKTRSLKRKSQTSSKNLTSIKHVADQANEINAIPTTTTIKDFISPHSNAAVCLKPSPNADLCKCLTCKKSRNKILEGFFMKNKNLDINTCNLLTTKTGLKPAQVKNWYYYKNRVCQGMVPKSGKKHGQMASASRRKKHIRIKCLKLNQEATEENNSDNKANSSQSVDNGMEIENEIVQTEGQDPNFEEHQKVDQISKLFIEAVTIVNPVFKNLPAELKNNNTIEKVQVVNKINITNWLNDNRPNEKSLKTTNVKHFRSKSKPKRAYKDDSNSIFSYFLQKPVKVELKDLPLRKKFATVKKIGISEFRIQIQNCQPLILKLYAVLNQKSEKVQEAVMKETNLLAPVFKLNNPFSFVQVLEMQNWQSTFLKAMLESENEMNWSGFVSSCGLLFRILDVWVPTLVYAGILQVPVAFAVEELYMLSLGRNEKPTVKNWRVPKLI